MKIDFSAPILDLGGKPVKHQDGANDVAKDMVLKDVAVPALTMPYKDEDNLAADDKVARAVIAQEIYRGGIVDVSVEDVALIKKLIGKAYGPLVVMRAYEILDPKEPLPKAAE